MDVKYNTKQLIAVEYPGTVLNVCNMSKTLGGEKQMFKCFNKPTKRLELRFRPDDPYCKCAHGDRFNTTNIVMKVIKRTKKHSTSNQTKMEPEVTMKIEFLGVASSSYKFKAIADFQLLPISFNQKEGVYQSLLPKIVPTKIHPASWLDEPSDLFVPPTLFSRFDLPQSGYVETHTKGKQYEIQKNLPPNIIGRGRKRRAGFTVFSTFDGNEPIDKPHPEAISQLQFHPLDIDIKEKLDILFLERPVWSKNELVLRLKCERPRLKFSLPCSAYYVNSGPWRALWVRFGYDPRKDPAAKHWQVLDLRISNNIPINEKRAKQRPAYYALPNKTIQKNIRAATINTNDLLPMVKEEDLSGEDGDYALKLSCRYLPGHLPPARQCFYQLCDIFLDSAQKLIHQNDGQEEFCLEKDGWLEVGVLDKVRELVLADIQKTAQEKKELEN